MLYNENRQGYPPYPGQYGYRDSRPVHAPSLVLGLVSLVGGIVTVAFTLGLVGIVCGIIGIVVARKNAARYKTTAGCVLSIIGIILCAIIAVSFLVLLKLMPDSLGAYYLRDVISFLCFTPQA